MNFFKHPFVLYGAIWLRKKAEYGYNAANNLGLPIFYPLHISFHRLVNLTFPLSSEYFFAASVTLFHISSWLDLVSLASIAITGAAISC
jgi:hypothetical protein